MIILASGSPRRQELLRKLCDNFTVEVSDAKEVQRADAPRILAIENAKLKAQSVAARHPDAAVVGADTIVTLDRKIFGKPDGVDGAEKMLRQLSGRRHEVVTGLALIVDGKIFTAAEVTAVFFGEMTTQEIRDYVATGEPLDKSGSYALQGGAAKFIEKIHGDWSNVVGLPIHRLKKLFEQAGVTLERSSTNIREIKNPLVAHKLAQLRDKSTPTKNFRALVDEIAMLLTCEVAKEFPTRAVDIETPIAACRAEVLDEENFVIVPILRAGLGMAQGVSKLLPAAPIGHIGMYRDEKTFEPVEYFFKMPPNFAEKTLLVVDPMLATGGSACDAIELLKARGAQKIIFMCIVAAPQGLEKLSTEYPDVEIFTAAIDERLNENRYIVPGLGDAGDRIFGTL